MAVHGRYGRPCRCAAPRSSVSATRRTKRTTVPAARPVAAFGRPALSRLLKRTWPPNHRRMGTSAGREEEELRRALPRGGFGAQLVWSRRVQRARACITSRTPVSRGWSTTLRLRRRLLCLRHEELGLDITSIHPARQGRVGAPPERVLCRTARWRRQNGHRLADEGRELAGRDTQSSAFLRTPGKE